MAATDAYRGALEEGARAMGIELDAALAQAMTAHYALVVKWAAKMNLTTVVDPIHAAHLHGLDSLLFVPLIPRRRLRVVDVGSGAGFPGIVVALARPELAMTLLEPKRKRASFLRVALAELSRSDVAVIEARLEESDREAPAAARAFPAEVILSRATIPPLDLVRRAAGRLSRDGTLICTSGASAPAVEAIAAAGAAVGLRHLARHERTLPRGETRVLDVLGATLAEMPVDRSGRGG